MCPEPTPSVFPNHRSQDNLPPLPGQLRLTLRLACGVREPSPDISQESRRPEATIARATKHACSTPGCPNLATRPGKCDAHATAHRRIRERNRDRPSASARGYDAEWNKIRNRYIARHLTCETEGCSAPSTDVDHIRPRRRGGSDRDENLQALCHRHHSRKTVLEDGGFGRAPRTKDTE